MAELEQAERTPDPPEPADVATGSSTPSPEDRTAATGSDQPPGPADGATADPSSTGTPTTGTPTTGTPTTGTPTTDESATGRSAVPDTAGEHRTGEHPTGAQTPSEAGTVEPQPVTESGAIDPSDPRTTATSTTATSTASIASTASETGTSETGHSETGAQPEAIPEGAVADGSTPGVGGERSGETAGDGATATPGAGAARTAPPGTSTRWPVQLAAIAAVAVVLLVVCGLLLKHNLRDSDTALRESAAETGQAVAIQLGTLGAANAQANLDELQRLSTGDLHDQLAQAAQAYPRLLQVQNVTSRGDVTAAGVERHDDKSATVLVTVTATITTGEAPAGQPRTYRMAIDLVRNGSSWLASKVDYVQ